MDVADKDIKPCNGCRHCEKTGDCIFKDDDMVTEIYPLLWQADVIAATPMFFYHVPAQLKALIDRTQTLWARKYKLNLSDPGRKHRCGFILAIGATIGENLFGGVELTARYLFGAIGASFDGSLTYRRIEKPGDMEKHSTFLKDVKNEVNRLLTPFLGRKRVLFACGENACRSQMAGAFIQTHGGDKIEVLIGGSNPTSEINPVMLEVMQEKGIDMAFRTPKSIEDASLNQHPDIFITMGCGEEYPFMPKTERRNWDLPDPAGKPIEFMRSVRDKIEKNVVGLLKEL
mmetsp:Transcript_3439/g.2043  ORF Transcript_3439/g.2043 Transcript_3439/m.2043 type:complete len:287 (-) Transcript_3439:5027-5887(-)